VAARRAPFIPEVIMFRVVTVEREYGSGGGLIARRAALDLGWKLLDHTLISNVAQAAQVDAGTVERYDEHVDSWWHRLNRGGLQAWSVAAGVALEDAQFFDADRTAELVQHCIAEAGAAGNCVIVGRGAECVLQGWEDVLRVFIYAPRGERVARVRTRTEEGRDIEKLIRATDRERASYIRTHYGREWKDPHLYHVMISSQIGIERAASTIVSAVLRGGHPESQ
jgi:cytidylate kinase